MLTTIMSAFREAATRDLLVTNLGVRKLHYYDMNQMSSERMVPPGCAGFSPCPLVRSIANKRASKSDRQIIPIGLTDRRSMLALACDLSWSLRQMWRREMPVPNRMPYPTG
jgi:hypothetical protein